MDARDEADWRAMRAGVLLSTIGLATFLLMPAFIEAIAADLHYSEREVGFVSAVVSLGTTAASLAAALWIRRLAWRTVALAMLAGLTVANGASMLIHAFVPFLVLQGLVGFCGGSLYSLSLTVLSDCRHPDRYFAFAIGAQTLYEVAGLFAGPLMIHHGGAAAVLGLFTALSVAGFALVGGVPLRGHACAPAAGEAAHGAALLSVPVGFALLGCFLFYMNIGAVWTYVERIGSAAGLSLAAVANGLAFSTAASMGGVAIASWLGGRRGYFLPIAASAAATVVSIALLAGTPRIGSYVVANVLYGIAWNLSMSCQYSLVNVVDRSRRAVAVAPAFHSAGGAAGPAIAALVVTSTDHSGVLWVATVTVLASVACFRVALRP